MQQFFYALFNGVASGMAIFLVAAGVTLIFGILKIINFSHGAFFMLGAYLTFAFVGDSIDSVAMLLAASLGAGLVVGALGWPVDKIVLEPHPQLRRAFRADRHLRAAARRQRRRQGDLGRGLSLGVAARGARRAR